MSPMRVGIAGAGIAGALLAWRLKLAERDLQVELAAPAWAGDATAASGGFVRGYEPDPEQRHLATSALAELRGSRLLRSWSRYEEIGSIYIPEAPPDAAAFAELDGAYLRDGRIVEPHAGYLSPALLREAVLADFGRMGGRLVPSAVGDIRPEPDGTVSWVIGGRRRSYELAVMAAGPWTPTLLGSAGYRTKLIQHGIYEVAAEAPLTCAFVDETTGLYGRPGHGGRLLLGVPAKEYDVDPGRPRPRPALVRRTTELANLTFPGLGLGEPAQVVAAADCYCDPPGLRLRAVGSVPNLLTFTGGSGGAAKTALAASRTAARDLLKTPVPA